VQIWDSARWSAGAKLVQVFVNTELESKPLQVADTQLMSGNTFRFKMVGERLPYI